MATLKLNNTTVFTETNGVASIPTGVTIGNGVKFPAGHIIQVVNAELAGSVSTSSSAFSDTGLTASITPASASHKILIHIVHNTVFKVTNDTWVNFRLVINGTPSFNFGEVLAYNAATQENNVGALVLNYLDSPNTTSSVTYSTQFNSNANLEVAGFNRNGTKSYITLMEVVA